MDAALFPIIIILGPILIGVTYSLLKMRYQSINKKELETLQNDINQIKTDIAESFQLFFIY
jgi:hypothetical protein